jgi:undecaprenyl-diphosphatase
MQDVFQDAASRQRQPTFWLSLSVKIFRLQVASERVLQMFIGPTQFDIRFAGELANLLGRYPVFDLAIESAVRHHVLGGFCFATYMFVLWTQSAKPGGERLRRHILTIMFGSVLAILLTFLAGTVVSWPPPSLHPRLAHLYPQYLTPNINTNSFPSQSTALYAAVAVGVFSLQRVGGAALLAGVLVLVGLPRLYLGGHYPTDVFVGLLLGFVGYFGACVSLKQSLAARLERVFETESWVRVLGDLSVFVWILQVAVDFREVVWVKNSFQYFFR